MSTMTLDPVEIERVITAPSDSRGASREVWFFGDVVIKRDVWAESANLSEYEFYLQFDGGSFEFEGERWDIVLPKTAMVGEYIIMERVRHPRLEIMEKNNVCNFCKMHTTILHIGFGSDPIKFHDHDSRCPGVAFLLALSGYMNDVHDINDTHSGNFMLDVENNKVIFIDFAS